MIRTSAVLLLLASSLVNAVFLDTRSPHNKWDDDDFMTIVSTTVSPTKSEDQTTPKDLEDLTTEEQKRPKFLSLIPPGTHESGGPSKSDQEELKYHFVPTTTDNSINTQNAIDTSTPQESSEESTSQSSDIEAGKPIHVQLGKIPLTIEMIPMREEKQQLLGRDESNPVSFFPMELNVPEEKSDDGREIDTIEIITGKPVPDLEVLPREPSPYMLPPSKNVDGENIWGLYSDASTTNSNDDSTTLNPLLERIADFLQKAKRQLDTETTTDPGNMQTTTEYASTPDDTQENFSTADPIAPNSDIPEDSNGDLNPSSPAPVPEEPETDEMMTSSRGPSVLYQQNVLSDPIVPPFPVGSSSSSVAPPVVNEIPAFRPSTPEQYFPTINSFDQRLDSYFYNPAAILRRRMMVPSTTTPVPPPSQNLYVPPQDLYWNNYDNNGRTNYRNEYYNPSNLYSPSNYNNYNQQGFQNNYNQAFLPNQNQGFSLNQNQGFLPNQNQGIPVNQNQRFLPNQNQGIQQRYDQSYNPYPTSPRREFGYYLRPQRQAYIVPQSIPYNDLTTSASQDTSFYGNALNDYSPRYARQPALESTAYQSYSPFANSYPQGNSVNSMNMYAPMYPYRQYPAINSDYF